MDRLAFADLSSSWVPSLFYYLWLTTDLHFLQQFNRSLRDYAWKILKIKLSNHGMWDHHQLVGHHSNFAFCNYFQGNSRMSTRKSCKRLTKQLVSDLIQQLEDGSSIRQHNSGLCSINLKGHCHALWQLLKKLEGAFTSIEFQN